MVDRRLSVPEVAKRLGIGRLSVYRRIWSGELVAEDLRQKTAKKATYRVCESELAAYLDRQRIAHPTVRAAA